jgi:cytoskeleton protein RodZ
MIGEKLEEARKRRGLSIREVSEATKIRGEYLAAMEDNSFNINLPEIYIRGFLKNYARFLRLDAIKLLTDYDAAQLNRASTAAGRPQRESFGRIEIPGAPEPREHASSVTSAPVEPTNEVRLPANRNEAREFYLKAGAVFVVIGILAVLVTLLVRLVTGGSSDAPVTATPATTAATTAPAAVGDSIVLTASESVTVIVEQTIDRQRLFSGTLNAGDRLPLEKNGPVSIRFSNGSALSIERNGQQMRISQSGVGITMIE